MSKYEFCGRIAAVDYKSGMLMLPRPINYVTAECGEVNAFYSPERNEVVMIRSP